jgi:hypothetical protein
MREEEEKMRAARYSRVAGRRKKTVKKKIERVWRKRNIPCKDAKKRKKDRAGQIKPGWKKKRDGKMKRRKENRVVRRGK